MRMPEETRCIALAGLQVPAVVDRLNDNSSIADFSIIEGRT